MIIITGNNEHNNNDNNNDDNHQHNNKGFAGPQTFGGAAADGERSRPTAPTEERLFIWGFDCNGDLTIMGI